MLRTRWICGENPIDQLGYKINYVNCTLKPGHKRDHSWDLCCKEERQKYRGQTRLAAKLHVQYRNSIDFEKQGKIDSQLRKLQNEVTKKRLSKILGS